MIKIVGSIKDGIVNQPKELQVHYNEIISVSLIIIILIVLVLYYILKISNSLGLLVALILSAMIVPCVVDLIDEVKTIHEIKNEKYDQSSKLENKSKYINKDKKPIIL